MSIDSRCAYPLRGGVCLLIDKTKRHLHRERLVQQSIISKIASYFFWNEQGLVTSHLHHSACRYHNIYRLSDIDRIHSSTDSLLL